MSALDLNDGAREIPFWMSKCAFLWQNNWQCLKTSQNFCYFTKPPQSLLGFYPCKYITSEPYHTFPLWISEPSYLCWEREKRIFCPVGIFIFVPRAPLRGCNGWRQPKMGWNQDTICRSACNTNEMAIQQNARNRNTIEVLWTWTLVHFRRVKSVKNTLLWKSQVHL